MKPNDDKHPDPEAADGAGGGQQNRSRSAFPIVGMGASAGGLEAFEAFFHACPRDTGIAFVLVPHLDPGHESLLGEILQRSTTMPVVQAMDQTAVLPDHVYVIPPNREMAILNGVLQISLPQQPRGQRLPIDAFLRSLADDQAENAIGVILSGTASDGTLGLRAILGAGGICMVQEPASARYDGMPRSAISAGYARHILPVADMPKALQELTQRDGLFRHREPKVAGKGISGLNQILLQIRSITGHDFSLYKKSTIGRRIERRMAQHRIDDTAVYARYLRENPAETHALFSELLINATSFFRDPEAFAALKQTILPPLLASRPSDYTFRVWVAGCATGEEAYSIAIVLHELREELKCGQQQDLRIQIYATDLDDDAIAVARAGAYPPNIAQDVTPERLRRFFVKDDTAAYRVSKDLRELVVFAVHNVIKDPPFTRLDLLSCRNVLIYLEPELQSRLIPTFHYALKPDGVLFLSTSESIASYTGLFSALDRRWKFYRCNHALPATRPGMADPPPWPRVKADRTMDTAARARTGRNSVAELSHRALLQSYAPASVTTDASGNILYVHGDTGKYLRPAPGPVTTNVVDMARQGLQAELRSALLKAAANLGTTLGREVLVRTNGEWSTVRFDVRPLPAAEGSEKLLLVSFQEVAQTTAAASGAGEPGATPLEVEHLAQLERELADTRASLHATIENQQAFGEELQSANEELQSSNEELETSREELQSLNEEVLTVNAELNAKMEQLIGMQNDMKNLLDNVRVGTLFLDQQLVIRRYTREAQRIYRLIPADLGRPLADIKSDLEGEDLLCDIRSVLETLTPCAREVRATDGSWYLARIQPYRTLDNVIDGVVLTFAEVTDFKRASEAVRRSEERLARAQELAHLGSWELDLASGRMHWSAEMFRIFGVAPAGTPLPLDELLERIGEDRQRVATALRQVADSRTPCAIDYRIRRPDGTLRHLHSRAIAADATERGSRLLGVTQDISDIVQGLAAGRAGGAGGEGEPR